MANIGGNILGTVQTKGYSFKNEIGEREHASGKEYEILGWLGLQNGDSKYNKFNAKIEESTHVFLCDYDEDIYALTDEDQDIKMVIKGKIYDVLLIDNPDEMDEQLEIYLRKIGGQNV